MPIPVPPTRQDSAPTERKVTMQSEYIAAVITDRPLRVQPNSNGFKLVHKFPDILPFKR